MGIFIEERLSFANQPVKPPFQETLLLTGFAKLKFILLSHT